MGADAITAGPLRDAHLGRGAVTASDPAEDPGQQRQMCQWRGDAWRGARGWRTPLPVPRCTGTTHLSPTCRCPSKTVKWARAGAPPGPGRECVQSAPGPHLHRNLPPTPTERPGMPCPSPASPVPRMSPTYVLPQGLKQAEHGPVRKLPEAWRWYLTSRVCCLQVFETTVG